MMQLLIINKQNKRKIILFQLADYFIDFIQSTPPHLDDFILLFLALITTTPQMYMHLTSQPL